MPTDMSAWSPEWGDDFGVQDTFTNTLVLEGFGVEEHGTHDLATDHVNITASVEHQDNQTSAIPAIEFAYVEVFERHRAP